MSTEEFLDECAGCVCHRAGCFGGAGAFSGGTSGVSGAAAGEELRRCTRRNSSQRDAFYLANVCYSSQRDAFYLFKPAWESAPRHAAFLS